MNFNGIDMSPYFSINNIVGRGISPSELSLVDVPGMDGAYVSSKRRPVRVIDMDITVRVGSGETLRKRIDEINEIFSVSEPAPIVFDDEPDMTYYGIPEATVDSLEFEGTYQGSISIVCPDPYKYGQEWGAHFENDGISFSRRGTAESRPIITLDVLKPVTFAIVQNQADEYMMIGQEGDVGKEVINPKTLLFEERGATLATWQKATSVDGGAITGSFGTDGTGITVPDYGSVAGWHGPSVIKEISPTQDFEVEAFLQSGTGRPDISFRVEVYLYDENMKNLGKMAVVDNTRAASRIVAEGRVGPRNTGKYLISQANYKYNWDYFYGMVRIRRVGKSFNFYVTRVGTNTKHVYSLSKNFTDNKNQYGGRLKYVQIHIGEYGTEPGNPSAKFFSVRTYSLRQPTKDQTPHIANNGDIITFDHEAREILINGEPRMDLKDFGATFFPVHRGTNSLVVMPSDSFHAHVSYREKYR